MYINRNHFWKNKNNLNQKYLTLNHYDTHDRMQCINTSKLHYTTMLLYTVFPTHRFTKIYVKIKIPKWSSTPQIYPKLKHLQTIKLIGKLALTTCISRSGHQEGPIRAHRLWWRSCQGGARAHRAWAHSLQWEYQKEGARVSRSACFVSRFSL